MNLLPLLPDDVPEPIDESIECLDLLHQIDEDDDTTVSSWEADFLDTVFKQSFPLTKAQIAIADRMIDQYL